MSDSEIVINSEVMVGRNMQFFIKTLSNEFNLVRKGVANISEEMYGFSRFVYELQVFLNNERNLNVKNTYILFASKSEYERTCPCLLQIAHRKFIGDFFYMLDENIRGKVKSAILNKQQNHIIRSIDSSQGEVVYKNKFESELSRWIATQTKMYFYFLMNNMTQQEIAEQKTSISLPGNPIGLLELRDLFKSHFQYTLQIEPQVSPEYQSLHKAVKTILNFKIRLFDELEFPTLLKIYCAINKIQTREIEMMCEDSVVSEEIKRIFKFLFEITISREINAALVFPECSAISTKYGENTDKFKLVPEHVKIMVTGMSREDKAKLIIYLKKEIEESKLPINPNVKKSKFGACFSKLIDIEILQLTESLSD